MELSALDTTQLDYGTVKEQFKSDLFYSNWPNTQVLQIETIAILLLHCFLGNSNKETCCVLWFLPFIGN